MLCPHVGMCMCVWSYVCMYGCTISNIGCCRHVHVYSLWRYISLMLKCPRQSSGCTKTTDVNVWRIQVLHALGAALMNNMQFCA